MPAQLPSIVQIAQRVQREVDLAVRRFRKDDRYDIGARIRACVTEVRRLGYRAWNSPERRRQLLQDLVDAVDDLKRVLENVQAPPWLSRTVHALLRHSAVRPGVRHFASARHISYSWGFRMTPVLR